MFGKLGLGLGLGAHRIVDRYGNMPAVFTVTSGDGTKYVRVKVSETTTVTPAGGTSIRIGSSGEFVTTPLTLAANTNQDIYFKDAGSFTIPQRKLVTYLYLQALGSSVITGDITGMNLTTLYLTNLGSSVITGDKTGMRLTSLSTTSAHLPLQAILTGMRQHTVPQQTSAHLLYRRHNWDEAYIPVPFRHRLIPDIWNESTEYYE
jgi:hypothetical protein